ncbi:Alpha/beta hydrolase family protein [Planctomycetes bacterium Pla163]|uniref:Alpha/beta hydrolase family protein n=1 Tax=Rohdeia mirabilis TaxID=2528008 RepID=A0A518D149_9BACT|nr:Alpha/beta hydrolase family protein [Planctomycetes bacterium Pla163]
MQDEHGDERRATSRASHAATKDSPKATMSAAGTRPRWRTWLRRAVLLSGVLLAVLFVAGELYARRDADPVLLAGRERLAGASLTELEATGGWRTLDAKIEGDGDLVVHARLRLPPGDGPHPVAIVMGGERTGRAVVDLVQPEREVALLGLDYPYSKPDPKPSGIGPNVREGRLIHAAVWDVVPSALLALDWLETRADIDSERMVLVGGSLGALFAPAIAALDERVAAVGLLLGAGDLGALVAANLKAPFPLPQVGGWVATVLVAPLEPLDHIARIAPRPVLFVAGEGDERMPRALAERLHERCGEPKEIRWLDLGHVNVRDPKFHTEVLGEVVAWFDRVGVTSR